MTTNINSRTQQLLTQYKEGQRNFKGYSLAKGNLANSKLPLIVIEEANLEEINFEKANLMGASLSRSNLRNANLKSANLMGADLIKVELENSNLTKALVSGANLSAANLQSADLSEASFVGSDLTAADFRGANLKGTNLKGANLRGANLTETNLEYVIVDSCDLKNAIIPDELRDMLFASEKEVDEDNIYSVSSANFEQVLEFNDESETINDDSYYEENKAQFFSSTDEDNSDDIDTGNLLQSEEYIEENSLELDNNQEYLENNDNNFIPINDQFSANIDSKDNEDLDIPNDLDSLDNLLNDNAISKQ
jgi:uncharacterized protein YjbI with pentapeptide repeats